MLERAIGGQFHTRSTEDSGENPRLKEAVNLLGQYVGFLRDSNIRVGVEHLFQQRVPERVGRNVLPAV